MYAQRQRPCSRRPLATTAVAATLLLVISAGGPRGAWGAPPRAAKLLPKSALAFVSVADATEFRTKLLESSWGQMSQNPQLKPLAERLFGTLDKAFAAVELRIGASLRELLALPQGELALAVVPQAKGPPAIVLLVDAGDHGAQVDKVVERATKILEELGGVRREEPAAGAQLVIFEFAGGTAGANQAAYFRKDGAIVAASNVAVLQSILQRWNGRSSDTLDENPNFAVISQRCRVSEQERPQVLLYADPIALVRNLAGDNAGARVGLAMLPALGLDGLLGVGGSVSLATAQYDMIVHAHVLLAQPRSGVLELIALGSGDMTPEAWVPGDAAAYSTLYWDVDTTYRKLAKLVDSFLGQGVLARQVRDPLKDRYGVDLEQEILPALSGRYTMVSMIEQPARLGSQGMILGARLKDVEKVQATLDKLVARDAAMFNKTSYGGKTYLEIQMPGAAPAATEGAPAEGTMPPGWQRPCCGILGDYFLLADRASFYRQAIVSLSDGSKSLATSLEYKLIASKLSRQAASPGMISFSRPEQSLRWVYDLAGSEETRRMLAERGETSPLLGDVGKALEEHPLPPFSVLEQYLAPGGAALTDDESGLHYQSFTLRRTTD